MEPVHLFIERIQGLILDCARSLISQEWTLDVIVIRLESVLAAIDELRFCDQRVVRILDTVIADISAYLDRQEISVQLMGRPKLVIDIAAIEYLLALNFTSKRIAEMHGISIRTLRRRMSDNGLNVRSTYTAISEEELEHKVKNLLLEFPNTGYKRMRGFLLQQKIKVTELKVRETMRRVDPEGVNQRTNQNRAIVRRVYFVQYANEMWHIDTHLKLIRWKMVIRGGVDGKSRTCVYLEAGTDNKAESNLSSFMQGVSRYGVPYRCRSDKGKENILVAEFMLENRGVNRASHICGRSVHNQRIERFWRDVQYGCTSFYKNIFLNLEEKGLLNVENSLHLYALHFVFIPRLNRHLSLFMEGWNLHPLSTENNRSPLQLMIEHKAPSHYDMMLPLNAFAQETTVNAPEDLQLFDTDDGINNPILNNYSISPYQARAIAEIDPLEESTTYGCNLYERCVGLLTN